MKATFSIVFSIFFLTLSPSLLFLLSFFVFLVRSFVSLSSHISFKSGCILHKLTRIFARMIACDKNNEQEQTQQTRESMFVSLVSFSFSLSMQFLSMIFLFLSFSFCYFSVTTSRTGCHGGTVCNTYYSSYYDYYYFFGTVY